MHAFPNAWTTHRLFIASLAAESASCFRPVRQATRRVQRLAASQPAVPVTVDRVVEKDMPLDVERRRHRRGVFDRRRASAGDRRAERRQLPSGRRCAGRAGALHARSIGRSKPRCIRPKRIWQRDTAQSANAKVIAQRMDDLVERGVGTREQRDTARTTAAALEAVVGANTRGCRKRESAAAVRDDSRTDRRAHRRADGHMPAISCAPTIRRRSSSSIR